MAQFVAKKVDASLPEVINKILNHKDPATQANPLKVTAIGSKVDEPPLIFY